MMEFCSLKEVYVIMSKRKPNSHKGDNGEVLVVGGSEDYVGAVALAGLAAFRAGVDWVTIAAPEKVARAISCLSANLITKKLKGSFFSSKHLKEVLKLSEKHDVVLIGNGIGLRKETVGFVKGFIK